MSDAVTATWVRWVVGLIAGVLMTVGSFAAGWAVKVQERLTDKGWSYQQQIGERERMDRTYLRRDEFALWAERFDEKLDDLKALVEKGSKDG